MYFKWNYFFVGLSKINNNGGVLLRNTHSIYEPNLLILWRLHLIIYKPFVLFIRPAGSDSHCSEICDFFIKFVHRRAAPFPESCQPSIFRGRLPIRPEKSDQVTSGYIVAISRHTEMLVYVRERCSTSEVRTCCDVGLDVVGRHFTRCLFRASPFIDNRSKVRQEVKLCSRVYQFITSRFTLTVLCPQPFQCSSIY